MRILEHEQFMTVALQLAKNSASTKEIPIGALLVENGQVVAKAHNSVEAEFNPLRHAEILTLEAAMKSRRVVDYRACTLYTTLEPCGMCAGAIAHMNIGTVVFGAYDPQYGCAFSATNLFEIMGANTRVIGGVLEDECKALLDEFFKSLRGRV